MKEDFRLSSGYSEKEEKAQEYRSICFWSHWVIAGAIASFIFGLIKSEEGFFKLGLVLIGVRGVQEIMKAYYRKVYEIDE